MNYAKELLQQELIKVDGVRDYLERLQIATGTEYKESISKVQDELLRQKHDYEYAIQLIENVGG